MEQQVRNHMLLLTFGTLALCGLFIGKAYHIDDTLMIWTAQQIAEHPADFYGFEVNWYGFYAPMVQVFLNPPGAAYYAAVFGSIFGWSEPVMHGCMALIAVALVLGVYRLARQLKGDPLPAAVIALVSPGILVSMGTMMTDLPMMALWVWAMVLWIKGLDERRSTANAISGLLIGLAALMKYFAISLVPLLLAYTLLSKRKHWVRALWLILPVILLALFDLYTEKRYGMSLFLEAGGVLKAFQEQSALNLSQKMLTALAFIGAGGAPALFIAPWLWRRTGRIALCTGGAVIAALTLVLAWSGWQAGVPEATYSWWFWPQYGLWIAAGIHIIALAIAEIWNSRDRITVLLVLWLGGTLYFGMFLNHFLNVRVILPSLLVVALLCARRLRRRTDAGAPAHSKPVWLGLTVGLALSLCTAYADTTLANSARAAAERIAPENRSGSTWFSGHWGFQYYMEARGAKPVDLTSSNIQAGDTIVTPMSGSNRLKFRASSYLDESFELPVCSWLTTMGAGSGAGFYSELWGPLPFVFGPTPPERYEVIVP